MWIARILPGLSAVVIKSITCGDAFGVCTSDRGILLTFGEGTSGALGHRNYDNVEHPKIVEALLGYEISKVVCGGSHVVIMTTDQEVA